MNLGDLFPLTIRGGDERPIYFMVSCTGSSTVGRLRHSLGRVITVKSGTKKTFRLVSPDRLRFISTENLYRYGSSEVFKRGFLLEGETLTMISGCRNAQQYYENIASENALFESGEAESNRWTDNLWQKLYPYFTDSGKELQRIRFGEIATPISETSERVLKRLGHSIEGGENLLTFEDVMRVVIEAYFESKSAVDEAQVENVYDVIEEAIDDYLKSEGGDVKRNVKNEVQREICRRYLMEEYALFYFNVRDAAALVYPGEHAKIMRSAANFWGNRRFGSDFNVDRFFVTRESLLNDKAYKYVLDQSVPARQQILEQEKKLESLERFSNYIDRGSIRLLASDLALQAESRKRVLQREREKRDRMNEHQPSRIEQLERMQRYKQQFAMPEADGEYSEERTFEDPRSKGEFKICGELCELDLKDIYNTNKIFLNHTSFALRNFTGDDFIELRSIPEQQWQAQGSDAHDLFDKIRLISVDEACESGVLSEDKDRFREVGFTSKEVINLVKVLDSNGKRVLIEKLKARMAEPQSPAFQEQQLVSNDMPIQQLIYSRPCQLPGTMGAAEDAVDLERLSSHQLPFLDNFCRYSRSGQLILSGLSTLFAGRNAYHISLEERSVVLAWEPGRCSSETVFSQQPSGDNSDLAEARSQSAQL